MSDSEKSKKRIFLVVLDSLGIGRAPDEALFGDEGSNTLASIASSDDWVVPNLAKIGLLSIPGVSGDIAAKRVSLEIDSGEKLFPAEIRSDLVSGAYGRMIEQSNGKDTTIGHWEMAGIISATPLPVYSEGFPAEVIREFAMQTGRKVLCNHPYSGTAVIKEYGREHMETGALIVYTSADSVFQIAAHESIVPVEQLYEYCRTARQILTGEHAVGRVIARPFVGNYPEYTRTSNRHDFSIAPPADTILDLLKARGESTISIGKINDIFAGRGISSSVRTSDNEDGVNKLVHVMTEDFSGLCFVNLVDFDAKYGHRNDVDGYAAALSRFDKRLPELIAALRKDDLMIITADHGCDPMTQSTDHSRETVPVLVAGPGVNPGTNLGTRETFADIAATIAEYFAIPKSPQDHFEGTSFLGQLIKSGNGRKK